LPLYIRVVDDANVTVPGQYYFRKIILVITYVRCFRNVYNWLNYLRFCLKNKVQNVRIKPIII